MSLQKSLVSVYTSIQIKEKKFNSKVIPFKVASKKNPKYLEINLTKYEQNAYTENYKVFVRIN